jgi:hypothetical protein
MKQSSISAKELLELLEAAIDGIDGYESETGDHRYWNSEKINRARSLLETVHSGASASKAPGFR